MSTDKDSAQSVYARFQRSLTSYADSAFLHIPRQATQHYTGTTIDYSYSDMAKAIEPARETYRQAGYDASHRVALLVENRAEFYIHFFALNSLGVCVVPVNPDFVVDEMSYVVDNSDVSIVITLRDYAAKISEAVGKIGREVDIHHVEEFSSLPKAGTGLITEKRQGELADAAILYTSGTTGKPKGCVLSNQFFFCVGDWYLNLGGHCAIERGVERMITPLPLFHTNALVWTLMAMMESGGCIIQLDRFHSSSWWQTVKETKATVLHYLGVMPAMLMNLYESESDKNEQIKFGLGGGVDPDMHAAFEERFGFPLVEGWAMTETGSGVCFMSQREPRHVGQRCMGKVTGDMEIRIVDDHDNDVEIGVPGELLVRRKGNNPKYGFFTEYYKNPEATSEAWQGGWFHTGDVVRQDEEASVFFVERKKNIIRRSGENIAAAEVENVLLQHPHVTNCAIAAVPDPIREEEVAACVMINGDDSKTKDMAISLVNHCLEKLSYFKAPGYIIFVEQLPVTSTQKVQRGELQKLCVDMLGKEEWFDCKTLKKKLK